MKIPDVIATSFRGTALFEPQTQIAASWLSARCEATLDNIHDQVLVDAGQEHQIIRELKAAGFQVVRQRI
jgi:hypothetical protein